MRKLDESAIVFLAENLSKVSWFTIEKSLVGEELVKSKEELSDIMVAYKSPFSNSKEALVEAVIRYFNEEKLEDLPALISLLININKGHLSKSDIEEINRCLLEYGLVYSDYENIVKPIFSEESLILEDKILGDLEKSLLRLDENLLKQYKSVWSAFVSGTADSNRQAVTSMRDLLNKIVEKYSRKQKDDKRNRKSKIKSILRPLRPKKLRKNIAEIIEHTIQAGSVGVHSDLSERDTAFILKVSECCLYILVKCIIQELEQN